MDELDSAREIIVDAIATLEHAIEGLMRGQAPRSSQVNILEAASTLRKAGEALRGYAERIDNSLSPPDRRDS